jgi:predicted  nucleic acid-binding Zn-ribbon protein
VGKPVERQNLSVLFTSLAVLIAVSTAWCFYQEFITRRPWIAYQDNFNKGYFVPKAQHDLDVAKTEFAKHEAEYKELQGKLAQAEAAVKDPAQRGPFEKARADLDRMNIKVEEAEQDVRFAKSDLDAAYYLYKHAAHSAPAELPEAEKRMRGVEGRIDKLNKMLTDVTLGRDAAQVHFDTFAGRITELEKQMDDLREPVSGAELKLDKAKDKGTEMTQFWIPDLANANPPGVDRCQNCHAAIDTCGFTDPHEIVAERKAIVAAGGTIDEAALTKKYCVDAEQMKAWEAELDKDPKRTTFTGYALPLVFQTHPHRNDLIGNNHPLGTFGCTICHGGEGPQTKGMGWHKFEHALDDHYWAGWNEPLLDLAEVDHKKLPDHAFVESMCSQCHRNDTELKYAPVLSDGRKFMSEIGCYGCHPIEGYDKMRHPGPTLTDVQAKLTPGWMENWIQYPRGWRPHTRMPNFWPEALDATGKVKEGSPEAKLRQEEVSAITAYLWTNRRRRPSPPRTQRAVRSWCRAWAATPATRSRRTTCAGRSRAATPATSRPISPTSAPRPTRAGSTGGSRTRPQCGPRRRCRTCASPIKRRPTSRCSSPSTPAARTSRKRRPSSARTTTPRPSPTWRSRANRSSTSTAALAATISMASRPRRRSAPI